MIRPLLTALIEYFLAYVIYKHGKVHKQTLFWVVFFLASYQLGEVFIFISGGSPESFKFAYIATTLLPALGVLLIEQVTKKNWGYLFFQTIALGFVAFILFTPQIIVHFEFGSFCIRVLEYNPIMKSYWIYFYQGTLLYTMALLVVSMFNAKDKSQENLLQKILLAYLSFDGVELLVTRLVPEMSFSIASLMCALALVAAFIFTFVSLGDSPLETLTIKQEEETSAI